MTDQPRGAARQRQGYWREHQLRDYLRAQGLCYRRGDKYEPGHQCAKKDQATVHALTVEEHQSELSSEVLDILAVADSTAEEQYHLSVHAMAGTVDNDTICLRALVKYQVLLILIDSGSTHSFLNSSFLERVSLPLTDMPPVTVRVTNGQQLQCDKMVKHMKWWTQGHTFEMDMHVLSMGAYDTILGMD